MSAAFGAFYIHLSDAELQEERARLIEQLKSFFDTQAVGSKSYSRSAKMLEDRIQATGVEISRRSCKNHLNGGVLGIVDWSNPNYNY